MRSNPFLYPDKRELKTWDPHKGVFMNILKKEYPRPQFERNDWINLNGEWSCSFDFSRSGDAKNWKESTGFEQKIQVPFCPESKLSGIGFTDFIEMMWYQREILIPQDWKGKRILLHFGAVDYKSVIYLDGNEVGRHTGGCSPFAIDITAAVTCGSSHNLVVRVEDYGREGLQPLGKQSPWLDSKYCSYTRTTGIWQTVWLEAVHPAALKQCRIIPDFDNGAFSFSPVFYQEPGNLKLTVSISDNGTEVVSKTLSATNGMMFSLTLPEPKEWNPKTPFLYDIAYMLEDETGIVDQVKSYAGLRKIHVENGCCYLNNKPIYLRFVLDQGYDPESIMTMKDDAAIIRDIELSMKAGFNGARLHQKIFDERFHYYADKMGYLTWAEFPDWGISFWQHFQPAKPGYNLSFRNYLAEWSTIIQRDWNHPSIIAWTPFNETRTFYDLEEHRRFLSDVYDLTKTLDPTRPVNDTSGYVHVKTDLWTIHHYAQDPQKLAEVLKTEPVYSENPDAEIRAWKGQPYLIDEYGGVKYIPEGKKPYATNSWGYNKEPLTREESMERINILTETILNNKKITGYCYTQLTDIEQEENGIYCYDRSEKFDMEIIRKCFSAKPEWSIY